MKALETYLLNPFYGLFAGMLYHALKLLPVDYASALMGRILRVLGPLLSKHRIARANLSQAFPDRDGAWIEATLRAMWENLGRTAGEYPHLDSFDCYAPDGRIQVAGAENIDALRDDGRPGLFFSGHLANWEIPSLATIQRGVPMARIYRAANNPYVEWLFRRRGGGDAELIPKGAKGARRALALLKEGGHIGMLVDQKMNDGIAVPFFGRPAMTAPALAQFALRFRCPVVPVRTERLNGARFRVTFHPPLALPEDADRHQAVTAVMTAVNNILEDWIRERPEQWLWVHRRWPGE